MKCQRQGAPVRIIGKTRRSRAQCACRAFHAHVPPQSATQAHIATRVAGSRRERGTDRERHRKEKRARTARARGVRIDLLTVIRSNNGLNRLFVLLAANHRLAEDRKVPGSHAVHKHQIHFAPFDIRAHHSTIILLPVARVVAVIVTADGGLARGALVAELQPHAVVLLQRLEPRLALVDVLHLERHRVIRPGFALRGHAPGLALEHRRRQVRPVAHVHVRAPVPAAAIVFRATPSALFARRLHLGADPASLGWCPALQLGHRVLQRVFRHRRTERQRANRLDATRPPLGLAGGCDELLRRRQGAAAAQQTSHQQTQPHRQRSTGQRASRPSHPRVPSAGSDVPLEPRDCSSRRAHLLAVVAAPGHRCHDLTAPFHRNAPGTICLPHLLECPSVSLLPHGLPGLTRWYRRFATEFKSHLAIWQPTCRDFSLFNSARLRKPFSDRCLVTLTTQGSLYEYSVAAERTLPIHSANFHPPIVITLGSVT